MNVLIKNDSIKGKINVTPSDSVALNDQYAHAIGCTGSGNIAVKFKDGTTETFAFTAGEIIKIQPEYIMATGTTATGVRIYKLYD